MPRKYLPKYAGIKHSVIAKEHMRQALGAAALGQKGMSHQAANRLFESFRREAETAGVAIEGLAWKVGI